MAADRSDKSLTHAWIALMGALAVHVTDEALNAFLPLYNEIAGQIRERFGFGPPTFTFTLWLGGLIVGIVIGLLLTPWMGRHSRTARTFATVFGALMTLNALLHFAGSIALGRPMPGVWSSPLLLVAAVWVVRQARATRGHP